MAQPTHHFSRQASRDDHAIPAITPRFFYESPLALDDPLSPVPPPQTGTVQSTRVSPRPFATIDNAALDQSWNDLRVRSLKSVEEKETERRRSEHSREPQPRNDRALHEFESHVGLAPDSVSSSRRESHSTESHVGSRTQSLARGSLEIARETIRSNRTNSLQNSPTSFEPVQRGTASIEKDSSVSGLTARPFARLPSRRRLHTVSSGLAASEGRQSEVIFGHTSTNNTSAGVSQLISTESAVQRSVPTARVAVGISRLHQVIMPGLSMEPIYWSPVHDVAAVVRATWFYKDTMLPVDVDVANMLEVGYLRLRPWTQTWQDELNSAVEVGASGEEKIVHRLWPEMPHAQPPSRPGSAMGSRATSVQGDPEILRQALVIAACEAIDTVASIGTDYKAAGATGTRGAGRKRYLDSAIIYTNEKDAYILRPNLQPSAYYGRRPLASYIRKGHDIGVSVVRGFDQNIWDKLNPPKRSKEASAAHKGVSTSDTGPRVDRRLKLDPGLSRSERPRVTDLILVIHGIGQKLSERVESFHFTHAMNGFRREVNVELGTPQVKSMLRKDLGGIMVLPVNWRSTLAFEEGGYRDELNKPSVNEYSLLDITPETLPSVRNIVSDVMLDIPYYLSHHQPRMIAAVISEANRIHKLWCANNPGFEDYGSVHIIAHSLGSVMAIDILSKQPTTVQAATDEEHDTSKHFRFDVKNLYLAGSPAGFFLLLRAATLVPRRSRSKPGSNGDDLTPGIAGEVGRYGCIAVDNIYNIINPYDPVSYRLNACVDAAHSASLKPAIIPSATTSWFSMGNPFKAAAVVTQHKKPSLLPRLPSNVELETHNFTREEIAEKRLFLLNDNGQIDFFLQYGGGPLDIQYLTMLGAHSSYWITKDFIRFIVLETGRRPGREGTLEALRPVKKKTIIR